MAAAPATQACSRPGSPSSPLRTSIICWLVLALVALSEGFCLPAPTRLASRSRIHASDIPAANDPRGVTGRFSVFAPNVTATVTVCEFRAELKKNLGEYRRRGTADEVCRD
jgi:hypothetical protein